MLPVPIDFDRSLYNTLALPCECVIDAFITWHVNTLHRQIECSSSTNPPIVNSFESNYGCGRSGLQHLQQQRRRSSFFRKATAIVNCFTISIRELFTGWSKKTGTQSITFVINLETINLLSQFVHHMTR